MEAATAGLLVFQVCAVGLALPGDCSEVGVVVAPAFAIPSASGWGRLGEQHCMAWEGQLSLGQRGAMAVAPGRGLELLDGSGHGVVVLSQFRPYLVSPLREVIIALQVVHILDILGYFPEKHGLYDIVQQVWLQGDELVHHKRGLVGPLAALVVRQAGGLLGGAEAAIRLFRSSVYGLATVAEGADGCPKAMRAAWTHGPVELL